MTLDEVAKLNEVAERLSDAVKHLEKSYTGDLGAFMLANEVNVALAMLDEMLQKYDADGKRKE